EEKKEEPVIAEQTEEPKAEDPKEAEKEDDKLEEEKEEKGEEGEEGYENIEEAGENEGQSISVSPVRKEEKAMWREWYDVDETTEMPEASYDQTQPDEIDDATWQRMTLAERRTALERQGRQFLGQSERQAYEEYVRQSQREAEQVQQTPEIMSHMSTRVPRILPS
ncbi:unnamed protein product, partial [Symbiodinium necroappetens]